MVPLSQHLLCAKAVVILDLTDPTDLCIDVMAEIVLQAAVLRHFVINPAKHVIARRRKKCVQTGCNQIQLRGNAPILAEMGKKKRIKSPTMHLQGQQKQ